MLNKFLFAIIAFMKLFKLEDTEYKGKGGVRAALPRK